MPLLPKLGEGATQPPDTFIVQLANTTKGSLSIGILKGDYMLFPPLAGAEPTTAAKYVLTLEQHVRYQQQLARQEIYQAWFAAGYLVDVATLPPPAPPAPEPEPEPEPTEPPTEPAADGGATP